MNKNKNDELLRIFGLNLKYERIKQRLSQDDLVERTNFSKPYISNVENAKHDISLSNACIFALALNCTLDDLLREK